jgi:hypothetical protein
MNERYKLSIAITLNKINEGIVNRDKYDITLVLNGTTKFSAVIFKKKNTLTRFTK